MLIKRAPDVRSSEITDRKLYVNRREFLRAAAGSAAAAAGLAAAGAAPVRLSAEQAAPHGRKFDNLQQSPLSTTGEKLNTWDQITTYNNFYEFGTDKESPSLYAKSLRTEPWRVVVEGEVAKPATYNLEDILKGQTLEERVYRLRCVEAWSMVIPWVGFPLANFIKRV
jgi:sulfoxide reductase catalytic subunit YedY